MHKIKIFRVMSLVILGVVVSFTLFKPMAAGEEYVELQRSQLLQTKDEWIIQFDIVNTENQDQNYTFEFLVDGRIHKHSVLVPSDAVYTYIFRLRSEEVASKDVYYTLYRMGEATTLAQGIYHLRRIGDGKD